MDNGNFLDSYDPMWESENRKSLKIDEHSFLCNSLDADRHEEMYQLMQLWKREAELFIVYFSVDGYAVNEGIQGNPVRDLLREIIAIKSSDEQLGSFGIVLCGTKTDLREDIALNSIDHQFQSSTRHS